jgi:hypothetical protein
MLRLQMFRPAAALAMATGLFLALSGCNNNKPPSDKGDKKSDSPPITNSIPNSNPTPSSDPSAAVPAPLPDAEKIDLNVGVGKEAMDFLGAFRASTVRADQLSSGFVKAIGLPAVFPADQAKGYSPDAAEGWLKRVGSRCGLSIPFMSKQVGNVALFQGTFIGPPGGYCLRMIHEGGAGATAPTGWKVDWLSLSSVEIQGTALNSSKADTVCQEFAVAAIVGTLMDKDALTKEDRAVVLAGGLTASLKNKWAVALPSDKAEGYDYNRGLLMQLMADKFTGIESFTPIQQGNTPVFRVEVTRSSGKAAYLVTLVKGSGPGQWLVDDVVPQ